MSTPTVVRRFDAPSAVIHGGGARSRLPDIAKELGATRVLLVTDSGVVSLGVADQIRDLLQSAGLAVAVFADVQPDPTDANVAAGVEALQSHQADLVVAVGGGSPIDAAKVISVRTANPGPLADYMGLHRIARTGVPLIAVPTTAGTGSEATKVAVITDTTRDVKMMMLSTPLMPRVALADYELTMSMPKPLTAAVGVDTLTHGIEAYVSKQANGLTDPLALECIALCSKHLQKAWNDPDDRTARAGMMLSATLGGLAFCNASVCLVHGMSRPLGVAFHIPHGLSNAVLLPTVTRFSVDAAPARYATVARTIGCATQSDSDAAASAALIDWLEALNRSLQLPRLADCRNVARPRFDELLTKMASDALASGSPNNNPRVPTADEIVALYQQAW